MATPDLDQTLSLKASMDDGITPALQKIDKGLKTTQEALNELTQAMGTSGEKVGSSAEGMASKTGEATGKVQKDLKETGGAFEELGTTAEKSSQRVGQALKDSLYNRDASQRLKDLDRELGHLKGTFEGMASTARPAQGRARSMQAIGKDTLSKKVIPAFQELHATLDDFPETLEDITRLEVGRLKNMGMLSKTMQGVSDRVSGFGERIDRIKFGIEDFAGAIMTTVAAVKGLELRGAQREAGRIGGVGAFQEAAKEVPRIMHATQAPMEVWGEAYNTLLDISRESHEVFPYLLDQMTSVHKITGIATESLAAMRVQMVEFGGVSDDVWNKMTDSVAAFAQNSRASMDELAAAMDDVARKVLRVSRDSRKAYAESALASAAASKEAGLTAQAGAEVWENLHSFLGQAQTSGLLNKTGVSYDVQKGLKSGDQLGGTLAVYEAVARWAESQGEENLKQEKFAAPFEAMFGQLGLTIEDAMMLRERRREEGDLRKLASMFEGKQFDAKALEEAIRGTASEQFERMSSMWSASGMDIGNQTMNAVEAGMDPLLATSSGLLDAFRKMNEQSGEFYNKGIAFFSIGLNVVSALKQVLPAIPIIGPMLAKVLDTKLGGLAAAALSMKVIADKVAGGAAGGYSASTLAATGMTATAMKGINIEDMRRAAERKTYDDFMSENIPIGVEKHRTTGLRGEGFYAPGAAQGISVPTLDKIGREYSMQQIDDKMKIYEERLRSADVVYRGDQYGAVRDNIKDQMNAERQRMRDMRAEDFSASKAETINLRDKWERDYGKERIRTAQTMEQHVLFKRQYWEGRKALEGSRGDLMADQSFIGALGQDYAMTAGKYAGQTISGLEAGGYTTAPIPGFDAPFGDSPAQKQIATVKAHTNVDAINQGKTDAQAETAKSVGESVVIQHKMLKALGMLVTQGDPDKKKKETVKRDAPKAQDEDTTSMEDQYAGH